MAVWQFVIDLIPSSAATIEGVAAARMSRDQIDAIELNFSQPTIAAILDRVGAILPEKRSWAPGLRIWGDETTNDIQIGFDQEAIREIQVRLNVGALPMSLIGEICTLARDFDFVLATRDGAIVRPYGEALVRTITKSDAARYVEDPERYLREAAARDPEPL